MQISVSKVDFLIKDNDELVTFLKSSVTTGTSFLFLLFSDVLVEIPFSVPKVLLFYSQVNPGFENMIRST